MPGAQAYLLKAMSHVDVTAAIRKVHSGARVIPQSVSKTLAERAPQSQLSAREVEVLELIANGFSNKEIGRALGITEATVKWHVNLILNRLDVARSHRGDRRGAATRHHPPAVKARCAGSADCGLPLRGLRLIALASLRIAAAPPPAPAHRRTPRLLQPPRSGRARTACPRISRRRSRRRPTAISGSGRAAASCASTASASPCSTPRNEPAFRDDSVYALLTAPRRHAVGGHRGRRSGPLSHRRRSARSATAEGLTNLFVRVDVRRSTAAGCGSAPTAACFDSKATRCVASTAATACPSMSVHTICEDREGRLLVGGAGLLVLNRRSRRVHYRSTESLRRQQHPHHSRDARTAPSGSAPSPACAGSTAASTAIHSRVPQDRRRHQHQRAVREPQRRACGSAPTAAA